jgi:hypothetical protein
VSSRASGNSVTEPSPNSTTYTQPIPGKSLNPQTEPIRSGSRRGWSNTRTLCDRDVGDEIDHLDVDFVPDVPACGLLAHRDLVGAADIAARGGETLDDIPDESSTTHRRVGHRRPSVTGDGTAGTPGAPLTGPARLRAVRLHTDGAKSLEGIPAPTRTNHGTRPDTPQPTAPLEDRQCHKDKRDGVLELVMVEAPVGYEVELPGVVLLVAVGVGRGHHPVLV